MDSADLVKNPAQAESVTLGTGWNGEPVVEVQTFGCSCCSDYVEVTDDEHLLYVLNDMGTRLEKKLAYIRRLHQAVKTTGCEGALEILQGRDW